MARTRYPCLEVAFEEAITLQQVPSAHTAYRNIIVPSQKIHHSLERGLFDHDFSRFFTESRPNFHCPAMRQFKELPTNEQISWPRAT